MNLAFESVGSGPPLLLLSGFGSDRLSWLFQRDEFAQRYQTFLIDNRGVGRSPAPPGPYTTAQMAQDVVELMDQNGIEKARIVGHSMGGRVAQELALRHPHRVQKLVLAASGPDVTERTLQILELWISAWVEEFDSDVLKREVLPWLYRPEFLSSGPRVGAILGAMRNHPYLPTAQGLRGQLAAVRDHQTRERLSQISCPTLLLVGAQDRLCPPEVCREMAGLIPNAQFKIVPEAGHALTREQADLFSELVLEYLN